MKVRTRWFWAKYRNEYTVGLGVRYYNYRFMTRRYCGLSFDVLVGIFNVEVES